MHATVVELIFLDILVDSGVLPCYLLVTARKWSSSDVKTLPSGIRPVGEGLVSAHCGSPDPLRRSTAVVGTERTPSYGDPLF